MRGPETVEFVPLGVVGRVGDPRFRRRHDLRHHRRHLVVDLHRLADPAFPRQRRLRPELAATAAHAT